jgi:hypothetical protein
MNIVTICVVNGDECLILFCFMIVVLKLCLIMVMEIVDDGIYYVIS